MIHPDTSIGAVRLRVADRGELTRFYERVVGLRVVEQGDALTRLGPDGGPALVELESAPDAPPAPGFSTGLFHMAFLVPDRRELARALRRVIAAEWRLTGASDHLVSEALYLQDPEDNGIEIYRDRPREEWGRNGGELRIVTLPLDLESVLGELPVGDEPDDGMPATGTMGHVHLRVSDIPASEGFYNGALGLDVMVRSYPGALFLSAGGYHHHVGVNTWQSQGAPAPPEGALGLAQYELVLPSTRDRDEVADGVGGVVTRDPSGNAVALTARTS